MRYSSVIISTFALSFIIGCSSLSKKDCQTTNWAQRGYAAGQRGDSESTLSPTEINFRKMFSRDCKKHAPAPNQTLYMSHLKKGYDATFCTTSRAQSDVNAQQELNKRCVRQPRYAQAFKKEFKSRCSASYGKELGSQGVDGTYCMSVKSFKWSYKKALKSYCSASQGETDGAELNQNSNCIVYRSYKSGLEKGYLRYCTHNQGYQHGSEGTSAAEPMCKSRGHYMSGYHEGLSQFCTFNNGKYLGIDGETTSKYHCHRRTHYSFYKGNENGLKIRELKEELEKKRKRLHKKEKDISLFQSNLVEAKSKTKAKTQKGKSNFFNKVKVNDFQSKLDQSQNDKTRIQRSMKKIKEELKVLQRE